MKKFYSLFVIYTAIFLGFFNSVLADELTVANGSTSNQYVPVYGYYCDTKDLKSQALYLSSDISAMAGKEITGLCFYAKDSYTSVSWGAARFDVKLAAVSNADLEDGPLTPSFTTVYSGALSVASKKLEIEFSTPFLYDGTKNLLLEIYVTTKGSYVKCEFLGVSTDDKMGLYSYPGWSGDQMEKFWFTPKTTFSYNGGSTCSKPKNLSKTASTTSSATFTWTKGGDETQWQYLCLPAATTLDWSNAGVKLTNSTTATITGLTASTDYKFYVRAYCAADDQSQEISKAFTTPCAGQSIPWSENFESMSVGNSSSPAPTCWNYINTNDGSYPYAYVASTYSYYRDAKALYLQASADKYSYIILPPFNVATNTLQASFWYKNAGTSGYYGQISIGYITDENDESTFIEIKACTKNTTFTEVKDVSFSAAPASARIAFRYGGGTYGNYAACIDDINISRPTSCVKPTSLGAVATSATSATITWTKGSSENAWNLQYSSNNGVSWTTLNLTTSNVSVSGSNCSYTLTGLTEQTTYKVKVQANCGGDDLSEYTSEVTFKTPCAAITSLPWTEDFTSGTNNTIMDCWDNYNSGTFTAATPTSRDYSYYVWGVYNYNSNNMLRMYNFSVRTGTAFINTPSIVLPASPGYKLTFDYAHNASCGAFNVKISTNGGSSFTTIGTYTKGSGSSYSDPGAFTNVSIDLSAYAGNTIILQFFANANYGDGAIFVDNINIKPAVDCTKPVGVTVSNLSATGARLSWTAREGVTSYAYRYVTHGSTPNWTGAPTTSNTYVNLTGLTTDQEYDFYVKCVCGGDASDAVAFTPTCIAPGTPNFSSPTADGGHVSWTAATGVTTYQYCLVPSGSDPDWSGNLTTTNLYKDITGLAPKTNYTFYVRSVCSAGVYSEPVSVTCRAAQITTLRFYNDGEEILKVTNAVLPYSTSSANSLIAAAGKSLTACDGYTFAGWVKDAPLLTETSSVTFTTSVPPTDDEFVDLYAVYSKTDNYYQKATSVTAINKTTPSKFIFVAEYKGNYYAMSNELLTGGEESGNLSVYLSQTDSYTKYLAGAKAVAVTYNDGRITDVPSSCVMYGKKSGSTWDITNGSNHLNLTAYLSASTKGYIKALFDTYNDFPPTNISINGTTGIATIIGTQTKSSKTHTWGLYFTPSVAANVIGTSAYSNVFIACGDEDTQPYDYNVYNQGTIYVYIPASSTTYKSRCQNYTVHFKACGSGSCPNFSISNPDRTEINNDGVALPTVSNVAIGCPEVWEFVGWNALPIPDQTYADPSATFITESPYIPYKNDTSIYAVYRHKTNGELDYWSSFPVCQPFNVYLNPGNGTINGSSDWYIETETSTGSGIYLPTTPKFKECNYWKHVGWVKEPYLGANSAPADLMTSDPDDPSTKYYPSVDGERLYAVYLMGSIFWSTYPMCDKSSFVLDAGSNGKIKHNGTVLDVSTRVYSETSQSGGLQLQAAEYNTSTGCSVWSFVGWSETKITGGATEEPAMYSAGFRYHPKSLDQDTLFAVYRRGTSPNYIWTTEPDCNPYNITLHANGTDEKEFTHLNHEATKLVSEPTIGAGVKFTDVPSIECPLRWTFVGWNKGNPIDRKYVEPTGLYHTNDNFKIMELGESFYAVYSHKTDGVVDYWTSNPTCEPYTVKIHSCEGTLAGGASEDIMTESVAGAGVTLPTPTPQCDSRGWSFEGWVIGEELTTTTDVSEITIYPAGKFVPTRNNLELYAVYSINAYKQVNSVLDLNTTSKYAIAIFHDYNGGYYFTDFALTNDQHSTKTNFLKLEPINSYFDKEGVKYVTNPSIDAQWKLEYNGIGANPAYKIKSVQTSKYLCFPAHEYSAENDALYSTNGEYHTNANSASEYYYYKISTISGQISTSRSGFEGEVLSFELADVSMSSFYSFIGTSSASCKLYRDMGKLYSSWPHCLEYTVYFDGCDGMSSDLSKTEAYPGIGVTLPTVNDICDDWEFAGWAKEPIYDNITSQTFDIYPAGSNYVPEHNNTTLYAIYVQRSNEFEKISSTTEIYTGTNLVIVYDHPYGGTYAVSNSLTEYGAIKPVSVSISSNKINNPATSLIWNLQGKKGAYSLYNAAANNYIDLTNSSNAKLSATIYDNINIQQSNFTDNTFTLSSNITGFYLTGSNLNFATKDPKSSAVSTTNDFAIYRQKLIGLCSYPCSKLVEPMRWGDGELIVESLDLTGDPESGSLYITNIESAEYGTYKITHTAKRGSRIRIKWGTNKYIMTVPYIATPTSVPYIGNEPTRNLAILPNAQFVVDQDITLNTVYVYDDAQLIVESNTLTIDTLIMRTEGDSTAPTIIVGSSGTIKINSNIVYHDRRIADDRYYFMALPFNSVLGDLRYTGLISNTTLAAPEYYKDYYMQDYDGQTRAWDAMTGNLKSTYWKHIISKENKAIASVYELRTGHGYLIGISDKNDAHKKRILRFKLTPEHNWLNTENGGVNKVIEVTPSAADRPENANNAGWNFIGNPYLHNYYSGTADESSGLKTGRYIKNSNGEWITAPDETQTIPYITYYNPEIQDYYQVRTDNSKIKPFSAVFVQIEHNDQLMFANPIETSVAPKDAPSYRRVASAKEPVTYSGITIESIGNEQLEPDNTGLVIADKYTTMYEIGGDLAKMSSPKRLHVYTISGDNHLAFNALDTKNAAHSIPVGVSIPQEGEYTFSFDDTQYDRKGLEYLFLTDNEEYITVDLLQEDYEFYINKGVNNTRFALKAYTRTSSDMTTDNTMVKDSDSPFCYNTDNGVTITNIQNPSEISVYDMSGRLVYYSANVNSRTSINLVSGVYNIVLRTQDNQNVLRCVVR